MSLWLTEDEARGKWCPAARNYGHEAGPFNRGAQGQADGSSPCIGSGCMAWRWAETHVGKPGEELRLTHDEYGFCGLAGFPNPRGERRAPDRDLAQHALRIESDAREFRRRLSGGGAFTLDEARDVLELVARMAATLREIA